MLNGAGCVARHQQEQLLAPPRQAGLPRRQDGHPRHHVGGVLEIERAVEQPLLAGERKRGRDVLALPVAEPSDDPHDSTGTIADQLDQAAILWIDAGDADRLDRDDQHPLVQRLVLLDLSPQPQRHRLAARAEEDHRGGTRRIGGRRAASSERKRSSEPSISLRLRVRISRPRRQVSITVESASATASGSQAPLSSFARFEVKKITSTISSTTPSAATFQAATRQTARSTVKKSSVSQMNVPVTARP